MAVLESVTKTHFGKREKWTLRNGFNIEVAFDDSVCVFFITNKRGVDFAEMVSKYFEAKEFQHEFSGSIDSMAIELPHSEKESALALIEQGW
jgi:hypothetical protein